MKRISVHKELKVEVDLLVRNQTEDLISQIVEATAEKNKKKLAEGDPSYIDTVRVKMATKRHYRDEGGGS